MLSAKDSRVCRAVWDGYMVHWSGTVYPCCNIDDVADGTSIRLGDARAQSLAEIDAGEPARRLRERHRVGRLSGTKCQVCLMTTQNQGYFDGASTPLVSFPSGDGPADRPFPLRRLEVELTDHCNLRCVMCWRTYMPVIHPGHANGGFFDFALFERLLGELAEFPEPSKLVNLQWIGEPMLHPRFFDFVRLVHDHPGMTASIVTNGVFLTDPAIEELLAIPRPDMHVGISINAGSRTSFAAVQGRDQYDLVVANTKRFLTRRAELGRIDGVGVQLKMVVMPDNEHEVESFRDEWSAFLDSIDTPFSVLDNFHGTPSSTTLLFSPETGGREDAALRFHRAMDRIFPRPPVDEQLAVLEHATGAPERAAARERLWQTVFLSVRPSERERALLALEATLDTVGSIAERREERLGILIGLAEHASPEHREQRLRALEDHLAATDRFEARELTRLASSTIRTLELRRAALEDGAWRGDDDAVVLRLVRTVLELAARWLPANETDAGAHEALLDAIDAARLAAPELLRPEPGPAAARWCALLDTAPGDGPAPRAAIAAAWRAASLFARRWAPAEWGRLLGALTRHREGLDGASVDALAEVACARLHDADEPLAGRLTASERLLALLLESDPEGHEATIRRVVAAETALLEREGDSRGDARRHAGRRLAALLDALERRRGPLAPAAPGAARISGELPGSAPRSGAPARVRLAAPLGDDEALVLRRPRGRALARLLPPEGAPDATRWRIPQLPLASDLWELAVLSIATGETRAATPLRVESDRPRELFASLHLPAPWRVEVRREPLAAPPDRPRLELLGLPEAVASGAAVDLRVELETPGRLPREALLGLAIETPEGLFLTGPNSSAAQPAGEAPRGAGERLSARFTIDALPLAPGRYPVTVGAFPSVGAAPIVYRAQLAELRVTGDDPPDGTVIRIRCERDDRD